MEKYLLEGIDSRNITRAVLGYLQQSLAALRVSDTVLMLQHAQAARQVARKCDDPFGEAAALMHIGTAWGRNKQFDQARRAFELAQRQYGRMPSWPERHNEALAFYCTGLALQRGFQNSSTDAVASFQKALDLLDEVRFFYAIAGDDRRLSAVGDLCEELRVRIQDQSSEGAIRESPFVVSLPAREARIEPIDAATTKWPLLPAGNLEGKHR